MKTRATFALPAALLLLCAHAFAGTCEDGAEKALPTDAVTYVQKHKVLESVDGPTSVEDTVRLWRRDEDSLCFAVDTVHTYMHLCSLSGQAKRIRSNVYGFSDENCKVEIEVTPKQVSLRVTDPTDSKRGLCNPSEAFGCGANTAIESGAFGRKP